MRSSSQQLLCYSALLFLFNIATGDIIQSPPEIVKEPSTDELFFQVAMKSDKEDKSFIIDCEAKGEPAPKYEWKKNDETFNWEAYDGRISQQLGNGSLNFTKPKDEDSGVYQCFAKNVWGTATFKSVKVIKAEFKPFNSEDQVIQAQEGESLKLACDPPTGWPKPNINWIKEYENGHIEKINNSRMTVDPEGNLWFSNAIQNDSTFQFKYSCGISSGKIERKYAYGNYVYLSVSQSPVPKLQNNVTPFQQYVTRSNEIAFRKKRVELFCIYGGNPLPKTDWLKDGKPIQLDRRVIQENFGKSLIIRIVKYSDKGNYTCKVSNGVGSPQSYNITLKVMAVPFFSLSPTIVEEVEGKTAVIKCEARGEPEPTIKWIHNGRPLSEAFPNPRRSVTANSITIVDLTKNDTGNYGCNATNSFGYVYKDVYINVLDSAPEITEAPQNVDTVDGRSVTIGCKRSGGPKPEVKWTRNNIELTSSERHRILDDGDLQIKEVGFDDAGNYNCIATNKYGTANASGQLTVKERTKILFKPEDKEAVVGSTATFNCTATADRSMRLNFDWFAENKPIHFDSGSRFNKSDNFSMTITKIIESDSGTYKCLAKTELDNVSASAELIVQDKPNPPQLLDIVCDKRDAVIKWEPKGDNRAPIFFYTVEYSTSFAPDSWSVASDNVPANNQTSYEYTVPMTPWADFTFRVIATNKIGRSNPSLHSNVCISQPDVPYKNPDNVKVNGKEPSSVVITWTPMPKIEHNAPGLRYTVYWKQDIPSQDWNSENIMDYTEKEFVITNLLAHQLYKVKVVAFNDVGKSNVTETEVIGYSGEDFPTEAPQSLKVLHFTGNGSLILSWEPVPLESIKGILKGYKIQFWNDGNGENNAIEEQVNSNATTVEIHSLLPNTKYYVRILAYNGNYSGPPSQLVSFVTPEAPKITESPRNVDTVDGRSVTIVCKRSGVPKPEVKWTRNNIELTSSERHRILDGGDLQIKEVGFDDAGNYNCIATNKYGTANASGQLTVKERTKILFKPEDKEAVVGSTATFNCTATADRSMRLNFDWFAENKPIHFDSGSRFNKSDNFSMTITKIIESDSGTYKCLAKTELDNVSASAELIVQDKPNPPELLEIICNKKNAVIKWQPKGDNQAPISSYTVEYNNSFAPDSWSVASDNVPANNQTPYEYTVPMTPWANFTFRVIATNKIGRSNPSLQSNVCTTQPDVPYKNPDDVEVAGTEPSNLVITWKPIPKIEHNAPGLIYRVYWKQDRPNQVWNYKDITDNTKKEFVLKGLPVYRRYFVRVIAINDKGSPRHLIQREVVGYSGEGEPTDAPQNLTVLNFTGSRSAILSWGPVSPESIKGNFKGYKIHFWTESDGESNATEIQVDSNTTTVEVYSLLPNTKYYMRILAYNNNFSGPPSQEISFVTPEAPGPMYGVTAKPWGSSSILLSWKKSEQANGVLNSYEITYESMTQHGVGKQTKRLSIKDAYQTTAKLASLKPDTNYKICIRATTKYENGELFIIKQHTKPPLPEGAELDKPEYSIESLDTNNFLHTVRFEWTPNLDGNPGSYFFVKYKLKGDSSYIETKHELEKNVIDVKDLKHGMYEFIVVVGDGDTKRESDIDEQEIPIVRLPGSQVGNMASSTWSTAIILILVSLISMVVVIYVIKHKRGRILYYVVNKWKIWKRQLSGRNKRFSDTISMETNSHTAQFGEDETCTGQQQRRVPRQSPIQTLQSAIIPSIDV